MKKLFPIFLIALLTTTVLSACGVPQEDYDKLASDLAAAQTQIQNLETQLPRSMTKITPCKRSWILPSPKMKISVQNMKIKLLSTRTLTPSVRGS